MLLTATPVYVGMSILSTQDANWTFSEPDSNGKLNVSEITVKITLMNKEVSRCYATQAHLWTMKTIEN